MTDYNNLRPLVQAEAENLTYYSYGMEFKEAKWITVTNGIDCVSVEFKIAVIRACLRLKSTSLGRHGGKILNFQGDSL